MAISGFALLLGFAAMQYSASGNASLGIDESNDSAQNGENPSASGRSTKLKKFRREGCLNTILEV